MNPSQILNYIGNHWEFIAGYAANTAVSLLILVPKSRAKFWAVVRIIHGVLNRIDPDAQSAK